MKNPLLLKFGLIGLLSFVLTFPLLMIDGLISERQQYRDEVLWDIASSSSFNQRLSGPLLVVPYLRTQREWKLDKETGQRVEEVRRHRGRLYFLPETFQLTGDLRTELRKRGIYEARLYHADTRIEGHFQLPPHYGITENLHEYRFDPPFLAVGISDVRGIERAVSLTLNGQSVDFQPSAQVAMLGSGIHASLPVLDESDQTPQRIDYAFDLGLLGSSRLDITPMGRDTQVTLRSDWPHPSFGGEFLPTQHDISEQGFTAQWRTSSFATNMEETLAACVQKNCDSLEGRSFGVALINPVDQYLKADRAIKYALLFILLTFAGFFLIELFKRLSLHPVQYALVGSALAVFYLLLLSLAEHLGFGIAYLISSSACVGLIGFYLCHVLRSVGRGLSFSLALAALYGLLYLLLGAEDYALLMGAMLLFGLLGAVMVITRRLDWYRLTRSEPKNP